MTSPKLRDGQLAWLAVREKLVRQDRRSMSGLTRRFYEKLRRRAAVREQVAAMRIRTSGRSGMPDLKIGDLEVTGSQSQRLANLSVAVDEVTRKLSETERLALRRDGSLPDWFLPEVRQVAKTIRMS